MNEPVIPHVCYVPMININVSIALCWLIVVAVDVMCLTMYVASVTCIAVTDTNSSSNFTVLLGFIVVGIGREVLLGLHHGRDWTGWGLRGLYVGRVGVDTRCSSSLVHLPQAPQAMALSFPHSIFTSGSSSS